MRRRLLDLCLRAYPRARRERDRAYLRDLALDLAERDGVARQALSLLIGGLRDRVRAGAWIRRVVVASFVLAALAAAALGVAGTRGGERIHEVEEISCVQVDRSPGVDGPCIAW
jgi:hypothetical protein